MRITNEDKEEKNKILFDMVFKFSISLFWDMNKNKNNVKQIKIKVERQRKDKWNVRTALFTTK